MLLREPLAGDDMTRLVREPLLAWLRRWEPLMTGEEGTVDGWEGPPWGRKASFRRRIP